MRPTQRSILIAAVIALFAVLPATAAAVPTNTVPPTITGSSTIGSTLTYTPGTWTGADSVEGYWADCSDTNYSPSLVCNLSAPTPTYTLTADDVGRYIFYVEYGTAPGFGHYEGPSNYIGPIEDPDHPFGLFFWGGSNWWVPSGTQADLNVAAMRADIGELTRTCVLDGDTLQTCETANSFVGLPDGRHSFTMTATDGTKTESISFDWTIGGVDTRFTATPDVLEKGPNAYFGWEIGTDLGNPTTECKLDRAPWGPCPGGASSTEADLYDLADGEHTFSIRAQADDGADGVQQADKTSFTWTVDTFGPEITTNLPEILTTETFNVEFGSNEPLASMQCALDGDEPQSCADGFALADLTDGEHALTVRSEDLAGNSTQSDFQFFVDIGATIAVFTQKPPHRTPASSVTIAWEGSSPGATFECRMDEPFWHPCTSPLQFSGLDDDHSSYNLLVRATKDGRTQAEPSRAHWHYEPDPIDLEWNHTPPRWTNSTDANFVVDADEKGVETVTFTCKLDAGEFEECDRETNLTALGVGEHTFTLRGTDGDSTDELSHTWTIAAADTPVIYWISTPRDPASLQSDYFEWGSEGVIDATECMLDNSAWFACNPSDPNPRQFETSNLAEGEHTLSVRAHQATPADVSNTISTTWTIDTQAPTLTLDGPASPTITELPAKLPLSSDEPLQSIECLFAGADLEPGNHPGDEYWYECSLDDLASYLPDGERSVTIRGRDAAGNNSNELTVEFTVAVNGPKVQVPQPEVPAQPTAPAAKTSLAKPSFYKKAKFRTPWVCANASCKISAKFKIGKRTLRLKSKTVTRGHGPVTFKVGTKAKRWMVNNRAGSNKATFVITITGASGSSTSSYKFKL